MKGVRRAKDEGRVVITLECKVSGERMMKSPAWEGDGVDVLRHLIDGYRHAGTNPLDYLKNRGVQILSQNIEVTK